MHADVYDASKKKGQTTSMKRWTKAGGSSCRNYSWGDLQGSQCPDVALAKMRWRFWRKQWGGKEARDVGTSFYKVEWNKGKVK